MPSQRDLDTAAEFSLRICDKCGWYDGFRHAERCNPLRGRAAARLIKSLPEVRAGQLGYGESCVVFDLSNDVSVIFECADRAFSLRDIHLSGDLNHAQAADLVRALKAWLDTTAAPRKDDVR